MEGPSFVQIFAFGYTVLSGLAQVAVFVYVRRVAKIKGDEQRLKSIETAIGERVKADEIEKQLKMRDERCAQHHQRTTSAEMRAERLQEQVAHLPTQTQLDSLKVAITSLSGDLQNVQGRLGGINRAVDLINEFLINQGGNRGGK
jgi:chromosome segregation ATPase